MSNAPTPADSRSAESDIRADPRPTAPAKWKLPLFCLLAGLIGGVLAWPAFERFHNWFQPSSRLIQEGNPLTGSPKMREEYTRVTQRQKSYNAMLSNGIFGAGIGLALGIVGTLARRSLGSLLFGSFRGAVLGALGGALGGWAGNLMAHRLEHADSLIRAVVQRALAWGILGFWVGICAGLGARERRRVVWGMTGGLLGGILGGIGLQVVLEIFFPSAVVLPTPGLHLVSLVIGGGTIGLLAGALAQSERRTKGPLA